jgi:hypothetical protein
MKVKKVLILLISILFLAFCLWGVKEFLLISKKGSVIKPKITKVEPLIPEDFFVKSLIPGKPIQTKIENIFGKPQKIQDNVGGKCYQYDGFFIVTEFYDNDEEIFKTCWIDKGDIETKRGITIGDSEKKIVKKYGDSGRIVNNEPVYEYYLKADEGYYRLYFGTKDNKVINIQFDIVSQ